MKKTLSCIIIAGSLLALATFAREEKNGYPYEHIPPSEQRTGDAGKGYQYLITGDFLKSGVPYDIYSYAYPKGLNYLERTGKNATVDYDYNVITNKDGIDVVIPTCLHCHAQLFDGKLYVGMGNSFADFSKVKQNSMAMMMLRSLQTSAPKKYDAVKDFIRSLAVVNPLMETDVRGVNAADRLAAILVAHRNPATLIWSDSTRLEIPQMVIPTDVPAWWLMKKKNAMFYTGFGRGDFGKYLMLSNILTVSDSAEAREVNSHFGDVLAYIRSIQPPAYPKPVDKALVAKGHTIFNTTCSHCHGTYGADGAYPNLLIPGSIINTDSILFLSNQQMKPFIDWFNTSWFAQAPNAAVLVPGNGYVAPPLDGVWVTAPYLHNGSVPTIEAVLNSKLRPKYWMRNFEQPEYDYEKLGWKYEQRDVPESKKTYNTTLPGYGNYGHEFGDALTNDERLAVIEYLKTL